MKTQELEKEIKELLSDIRFPEEVIDEVNGYHYWRIPTGNNGWFCTGVKGYEEYCNALKEAAKTYKLNK